MRMKKVLSYLFILGALMLLSGTAIYITGWTYAPHLFIAGALLVAIAQTFSPACGDSITLKRLRRQQLFASLLLVVSGPLMLFSHGNEWIITLTIAAVLELYTAWRIPQEEEKSQQSHNNSMK